MYNENKMTIFDFLGTDSELPTLKIIPAYVRKLQKGHTLRITVGTYVRMLCKCIGKPQKELSCE